MSKTMLQIICVMLFMCLVLVGCQKPGSTTGDTTADSRTEGTTGPQIKPVDYNEHVFHVLEVGRIDSLNNFAGYQTGDVLSAAIYRRNAEVEQLFNIKITYEQYATGVTSMSPDGYGRLEKASLSGTTDYDIAVVPGYDVGMLACNGFLYDFYSIPGIDLKNEYWDQQTIDACSIKKMLFFVTGDLVLDAFDSTMCIAFNKKLVVDHGIDENFYALVEKGEWTIDKFIAISQLVNEDLNGDGVYNDKDLYGTLVWNDSIYGVVNAAGQRVVTLDADDNMELTLGTETTFSVFTKYVEFVKSNAALRFQQNFLANGSTTQNPASTLHVTMFQNDQALFLTATIKMLAKFREMDANYGILPYFKYDTSQNAYHSPLSGYDIRYLCVPVIQ